MQHRAWWHASGGHDNSQSVGPPNRIDSVQRPCIHTYCTYCRYWNLVVTGFGDANDRRAEQNQNQNQNQRKSRTSNKNKAGSSCRLALALTGLIYFHLLVYSTTTPYHVQYMGKHSTRETRSVVEIPHILYSQTLDFPSVPGG